MHEMDEENKGGARIFVFEFASRPNLRLVLSRRSRLEMRCDVEIVETTLPSSRRDKNRDGSVRLEKVVLCRSWSRENFALVSLSLTFRLLQIGFKGKFAISERQNTRNKLCYNDNLLQIQATTSHHNITQAHDSPRSTA